MVAHSLDLGHVSDEFAIAPQLGAHDLEPLRAMGYRSVLILRPDGEAPGQPNHQQMIAAAGRVGLAARFMPVDEAMMGPGDLRSFMLNLKALPAPLVAYSGTGRRAIALWALSMVGRMPALEILDTALRVGHDLADMAPVLEA